MLNNILIVNATYFPDLGGSGIITRNIAKEFKSKGYNVSIFCGGKLNKTESLEGINIIRNDTRKYSSPYILSNYFNPTIESIFLKAIKENNINVIHFHSIQGLGANLINLSLNIGIKTVLTMHDFWWVCPLLFLNDEYLSSKPARNHHKYCTSIIPKNNLLDRKNYLFNILENKKLIVTTVSKSMKNALEFTQIPNAKNYTCVENGIKKETIHEFTKITKNKKINFAYFGGENIGKGFGLIFKASKLLKFNTDNYKIHLYGIHRPNLKQFLNHKLLNKHSIKLHGIYDNIEIPKIMSSIDIILIPSQMFESFSLIAREALLNNKIVISSGMGGLSEIHNTKHLTYNKNSSVDLANKMFFAMTNINNLNETNTPIKYITLEKQTELYQKIYNRE